MRRAAIAAAAVVAAGCGSGPPSSPPAGGATIVHGTERLAWSQAGHVSGLRFRAYVDDTPVPLDAAVCDGAPEAVCSSPLPSMSDGPHTIALATMLGSGPESERSETIEVEKVRDGAASLASLRDAGGGFRAIGLQATVAVAPDLVFAADVVARGIHAPAQMAAAPDGRLLVAESNGSVRVVHPGDASRITRALDVQRSRRMLAVDAIASPGLAIDPGFADNHFVYLASIADEGSGPRLRVIRLREVGDTLGEAASLFETTVVGPIASGEGASPAQGPRLAFGPEGLLYVALPTGFTFDREPSASRPHASMLRLQPDGAVSDVPLTGVRAHPLAFTWDPSTDALWLAFAGEAVTTLEPVPAGGHPGPAPGRRVARSIGPVRVPTTVRRLRGGPALFLANAAGLQTHGLAQALLRTPGTSATVRLAWPVMAPGLADRIGDVVSGADGTWFAMTSNADAPGDVIVRLRRLE